MDIVPELVEPLRNGGNCHREASEIPIQDQSAAPAGRATASRGSAPTAGRSRRPGGANRRWIDQTAFRHRSKRTNLEAFLRSGRKSSGSRRRPQSRDRVRTGRPPIAECTIQQPAGDNHRRLRAGVDFRSKRSDRLVPARRPRPPASKAVIGGDEISAAGGGIATVASSWRPSENASSATASPSGSGS